MTITNTPSEIKGFAEREAQNPIIKKLHRISNKTLLVIDEAIINRIGIDKENAWVEEIITDNGILIKICRDNVNSGDSSR